MSTADRLAEALTEIGLDALAERARTGEFDDFRSEHAAPQHALISELRSAARPDNHRAVKRMIERVRAGEFDATREEARAWAESEEGQETLRALMEGT
jgi:hypothetical protein